MNNLTENMLNEFRKDLVHYQKMYDYYIGKQDIYKNFKQLVGKHNKPSVVNYVQKFINEEINYTLGNALSYVSKSSNADIINVVDKALFHWQTNHNSEVMKQLEIFGKVYLLNYIDSKGRFCERVLTPLNAIAYTDDESRVQRFIHIYKKKYDTSEWYDVYYNNDKHTIETYNDGKLVSTSYHSFSSIPVSVCQMNNIHDAIYYKIKSLQDAYNLVLSTNICNIADYRNAYLILKGTTVDEQTIEQLRKDDIMPMPKDANAEWLIKNLDSDTIEKTLNKLEYAMYVACNHIDGNESLPSNTSGVALRSRLVFLEQIAKSIYKLVEDAIYDRLERLFSFIDLKYSKSFEVEDIQINFTPNVPQDETVIIQNIVQLGDLLSHETKLKLLPFIENPADELAKIKAEKEAIDNVNVDALSQLLQNRGA